MSTDSAINEAIELLKKLISTPRTSRNEHEAAGVVQDNMTAHGYTAERIGDNILCRSRYFEASRPALLLNSHIDTVKPVSSWTKDPFCPLVQDGRLYGLGSNDAGASLVSLLYTFYLIDALPNDLNMIFLATCQEEVSGEGGMKTMVGLLPDISLAIVGEPTDMKPAIAEKGLMVLDISVQGKSGHAARNEGINAIYRAMEVVGLLKEYKFGKVSPVLGPVKMTVTVINAGTTHNVIPDLCNLTVDIRSNEHYSNRQIFDMIRGMLPEWCTVKARSFNLNSSHIDSCHPLIQRAAAMGLEPFGSPTLSDQALLDCPSFKIGPGSSSRSHSADEYIMLSEIGNAVRTYKSLLDPQ